MIKPDVTFEEIVNGYVIKETVQENGKFFVSVQKRCGDVAGHSPYVGLIEGYNGAWKVINDPRFETGVLAKAVKRCIDNYLRYMVEFEEIVKTNWE